jgi:anti-anti-sigma regulatory factor
MQIELHTRRPFSASEEDVADWRVLRVTGEVDAGSAGVLATLVVYAVRRGARQVCLDLSGVERLDRGGAAALRRCTDAARHAGGRVAMIEPGDPGVAAMLADSGADRDVPHFRGRDELPGTNRPRRGGAARRRATRPRRPSSAR